MLDFVESGGRLLLVGDPTPFNFEVNEDLASFDFTLDSDEMPLNSLDNAFDLVNPSEMISTVRFAAKRSLI